jgi:hypothetical protein
MSSAFPEDEDPRAAAKVTANAAERELKAKQRKSVTDAHLMYLQYHRHHQSATAEAKSHDHKEVPDFAMFHRVSKTGVSESCGDQLVCCSRIIGTALWI